MLNLNSIMVGSMQPQALSKFYEEVLGKKPDMTEGNWSGWSVESSYFSVGEHSEMIGKTKDAGRIMFNFETSEVEEEFERISKIDGASVVKEPYQMGDEGMWVATFADLDGNYFQLMSPWTK